MSKRKYYFTNRDRVRNLDVGLDCPEDSLVDPTYVPHDLGELVKMIETEGYEPKRISMVNLDNGLPGPIRMCDDFAAQFRSIEEAKSRLQKRIDNLVESERLLHQQEQQRQEQQQ